MAKVEGDDDPRDRLRAVLRSREQGAHVLGYFA
jgi:hypothetical protein